MFIIGLIRSRMNEALIYVKSMCLGTYVEESFCLSSNAFNGYIHLVTSQKTNPAPVANRKINIYMMETS